MATKNSNDFFSDDIMDLFNVADMDVDCSATSGSMSTLISSLDEESSAQRKLEVIQNLVFEFVPTISIGDIEEKLLRHLMPAAKNLVDYIFKTICRTLLVAGVEQKSCDTLNIVQEHLQMVVSVHEALNCILKHILQNDVVDFCKIQTVPINVTHTLLLSFQHCKESDKLYQIYFDDLKEILSLFKAAQDVHIKLLQLLDRHVNLSSLVEEHVLVLKNVLDVLAEIGEVLVNMNVKALADNWKGYLSVTQKLSGQLNRSSFQISKPLAFLASEISRNLESVLKMGANQKETGQTLKICNFFAKIVAKLCEIFLPSLERISEDVVRFLSRICCYYPPFLLFKGNDAAVVRQINASIFACFDPLIEKLVGEPEFFMGHTGFSGKDFSNPGSLFLLTLLLRKLSCVDVHRCDVCAVVNLFFDVVKRSYAELFWNISIGDERRSLYNENLINLAIGVLSLNKEQYNQVEVVLLKNILQDSVWPALIATDVWCLVLRQKPKLCYETLTVIMSKSELFPSDNVAKYPRHVFLESFVQRLYSFLPQHIQIDLADKFPPANHVDKWKTFGLSNFPRNRITMIESLLSRVAEKLEELNVGKCSIKDYRFLCDSLDAISTLPEGDGFDLRYVLMAMVKIWDCAPNDGVLFKQFMERLCQASANFAMRFENGQLLLILSKLKQSPSSFAMKIQITKLLKALSTKSFKLSPEQNQITSIISELFRSLLLDKNPIIRQHTLEGFLDFINATPHEEIVQNAVRNEAELQRVVSNFIQKNVEDASISMDEYFAKQKRYEFWPKRFDEVEKKNLNVRTRSDDAEIDLILKRIRGDVQLLHKLCGKEDMFRENVAEVINILSRQICYKA